MKILRVVSDLYPNVIGGIPLHAHYLSRDISKKGHFVTVFTCTNDRIKYKKRYEKRDGYEIVYHKTFFSLLGNRFSPDILKSLMKTKNDYDLIHAHSHLYLATNVCSLVRKMGSVPLVITTHGLIGQTAPYWFSKSYLLSVGKLTLKCADGIISYTDVEKETLSKLGIDKKKIEVIPNGIDTKLFIPHKKEGGDSQILWVGRFVPGKGVEYLIDAFNILLKEHSAAKLLMIGGGPLKEKIEQKIQDLDLAGSVFIKELIPNSKLPEMYQSSDVLVLPSIHEGIPRTILEAMACGVPVVCTELPQLVDVVKGCGLLVPLRDSQALANAISKIISDRKLAQKFGEKGRAKVVKNHSWEDTVKKTISLYEELIC